MLRIGDFSRLSRVSVKMLRHYDDIGLLKPAQVDLFTGYRYYSLDQAPRLHRIVALKDLGFSLDEIRRLLDGDLSGDQLRGLLKLKQVEIMARLQEEQERLARVEAQIQQIETETGAVPYEVVLRRVEPQWVATIRRELTSEDDMGVLFESLETTVAAHRARASSPPLTIYYDADYNEAEFDVEVAIPIIRPIPESEGMTVRELPGYEPMACLVYTGDYAALSNALTALIRWIETSGYEVVGPGREVYLRFAANQIGYSLPSMFVVSEVTEFVTELQYPVAKRASPTIGIAM